MAPASCALSGQLVEGGLHGRPKPAAMQFEQVFVFVDDGLVAEGAGVPGKRRNQGIQFRPENKGVAGRGEEGKKVDFLGRVQFEAEKRKYALLRAQAAAKAGQFKAALWSVIAMRSMPRSRATLAMREGDMERSAQGLRQE